MNKALIAIDRSKSFRVYLTISTDLVQEAAKIHDTTPLASAGLGRVLTAAGLMGIMLKDDDNKLTLHFKGDGPARQILATAYGDGRVKGYIYNPYVDLPLNDQGKLDVGGSLGVGDLTVIKDLGLKEPYTGTIALVDGEIADDLNHLDDVLAEFDRVIGLDRLKAIHLNDSLNPFGAHKDRHARIGEGQIGKAALIRVVCHPLLKHLPFYLETPNELDGYAAEIQLMRQASVAMGE